MGIRKNYERFDKEYERRKAEGRSGWVDRDAEDWVLHLSNLESVLNADFCPKGGKALDLGCGAGCWSIELARRDFAVVGVDLSPVAIAWARQRAGEMDLPLRFVHQSVLELDDWAEEAFDFILDGFCLHCLIGIDDRKKYLETACRLLKPGGIFFVQAFCAEVLDDAAWKGWNIDPATRCEMSSDGVATRYVGTPHAIRDEIRAAGFTILRDEIVPCAGGMLKLAATRT
jgi:2-polyprenyl-3-methyl-5-hydroxy-6-metoxy-1,4-benzoquinol methylase